MYLGIGIATQSLKAVVTGDAQRLRGASRHHFRLEHAQPWRARQDPVPQIVAQRPASATVADVHRLAVREHLKRPHRQVARRRGRTQLRQFGWIAVPLPNERRYLGPCIFDRICPTSNISIAYQAQSLVDWRASREDDWHLKVADARRCHYCFDRQLEAHLFAFLDADNSAKRPKTLGGLTLFGAILQVWATDTSLPPRPLSSHCGTRHLVFCL